MSATSFSRRVPGEGPRGPTFIGAIDRPWRWPVFRTGAGQTYRHAFRACPIGHRTCEQRSVRQGASGTIGPVSRRRSIHAEAPMIPTLLLPWGALTVRSARAHPERTNAAERQMNIPVDDRAKHAGRARQHTTRQWVPTWTPLLPAGKTGSFLWYGGKAQAAPYRLCDPSPACSAVR